MPQVQHDRYAPYAWLAQILLKLLIFNLFTICGDLVLDKISKGTDAL